MMKRVSTNTALLKAFSSLMELVTCMNEKMPLCFVKSQYFRSLPSIILLTIFHSLSITLVIGISSIYVHE